MHFISGPFLVSGTLWAQCKLGGKSHGTIVHEFYNYVYNIIICSLSLSHLIFILNRSSSSGLSLVSIEIKSSIIFSLMKTNNCINRILGKTLSRGFPLYET